MTNTEAAPSQWARLPTRHGEFRARAFRCGDEEHLVLGMGAVEGQPDVLVRIHSECLTGDVLGSLRCDCGAQLELSLEAIALAGKGVLVYLRGHEGRGIGLSQKLAAYRLQDQGMDTVDANLHLGLPIDARTYEAAAAILTELGLSTLRLLTNNPEKIAQLNQAPLTVVERVPLRVPMHPETRRYLETKQRRMGHWLDLAETHTGGGSAER
jgi:GTP cyclohydrolase II